MKYSNASSLIERDQPLFISPLLFQRKEIICVHERQKEGKEKKKKKRRNRTTHDAIQRALLERFDKWQRNCGGEVRTCPHLEQLGRGSTPLSRACKLCVRRMVKIRERIGWSKGFFSVNFHTEGGPPARTPDRSIKFQRRNGNTWTYFTLLKSCLIRRKSGWEKPLSMLSINWNSIGPPIVLSSLSKIASWILRIWCCNFLFFLLFFWERRERNKDRFKRTWENFKRLPRGCTAYDLIILYEAGISFFGRKRRKCEEIL